MYTLGTRRTFTAEHYLMGGEFGDEGLRHSHHYTLEAALENNSLNQQGFVADIIQVEQVLDIIVAELQDSLLNNLPELQGLNPSIENLATFIARKLSHELSKEEPEAISITIWEDDKAWAKYRLDRP